MMMMMTMMMMMMNDDDDDDGVDQDAVARLDEIDVAGNFPPQKVPVGHEFSKSTNTK